MIPDEIVEQVAQQADIVAIIGEHVRLKKTGSVWRGPCPFHQGTNANFSVMPRGTWVVSQSRPPSRSARASSSRYHEGVRSRPFSSAR